MILERPHAFLTYNIAPAHPHHLLIVPKRHTITIRECSPEESAQMNALVTEGTTLLHKLGYACAALLLRDGPHPGKTIEHLHYHLIPNTEMRPVPDAEKAKREDPRVMLTPEEIAKTLADFEQAKHS